MIQKIVTPSVPNFIKVEMGKKECVTLPVSDFSEEELKKVGEDWTKELILKAKNARYRQ